MLCSGHYKEYLVGLINKNHIDPVVIMTVDELKKLLRRREMSCPKMSSNELEANYRKRLIKVTSLICETRHFHTQKDLVVGCFFNFFVVVLCFTVLCH